MQDYLNTLKAFVEGEMTLTDWRIWFDKNAITIEPKLSRLHFLRLKHKPFQEAEKILNEYGVAHRPDYSKCEVCRETLFKPVPNETTSEEIVEFARRATFPGAEIIEAEGWIHPGMYCPNGCTTIFLNFGSGDLWERMRKDFERTHTCSATITGDATLPNPFENYRVYIDGNIDKTRREDVQPDNGEFVWLLPGEHRIIVCEVDVKKVDRLESNTIWFVVSEGEALNFVVGMSDGQLVLRQHYSCTSAESL